MDSVVGATSLLAGDRSDNILMTALIVDREALVAVSPILRLVPPKLCGRLSSCLELLLDVLRGHFFGSRELWGQLVAH